MGGGSDQSYVGVEKAITTAPLVTYFLCPADQPTIDAAQTISTTTNPRWIYDNSAYLTGYSSYLYNGEVLGYGNIKDTLQGAIKLDHNRLQGDVARCRQQSNTMLMCDGHAVFMQYFNRGTFYGYGIETAASPLTLADYFNLGTCQQEAFDTRRHHGQMNILYVDGHVSNTAILSNSGYGRPLLDAGSGPTGALFYPNDRPSGYSGGTMSGVGSTPVTPGSASNVITGGVGSSQGLAGTYIDVDFH